MKKPLALIIEDDRDIAALFRHVLDIAGYHTEVILHGREALRRLASIRPDIVLLDLSLPGVPGEKILEQIRADERLKDVPVVVVTAYSQVADGLRVEPDLVLLKPVNMDQLSILVQRLRSTGGSMNEPPWETSTHLYNRSFFNVRLSYSLERIKQLGKGQFGVLFFDLGPFALLQEQLEVEELKTFLHDTADHLKTLLRPTDTIAYDGQGLFMILIEEAVNQAVPARILARLQSDLVNYLSREGYGETVKVLVGGVLCDTEYPTAEAIMADVAFARQLVRGSVEHVLFDRDHLNRMR